MANKTLIQIELDEEDTTKLDAICKKADLRRAPFIRQIIREVYDKTIDIERISIIGPRIVAVQHADGRQEIDPVLKPA